MEPSVRVLIIGESILMEGIVVSLEQDPAIEVLRICILDDEALCCIQRFNPHIIICPIDTPCIEEICSKLCSSSGIQFLVLRSDHSHVVIVECSSFETQSMADLKQLIAAPVGGPRRSSQRADGKGGI